MSNNSRHRNYCYTLNNYTDEEKENLWAIECRYHIQGFECGASGTPHIQGYICFKNARTFSSVKNTLGGRAHIEVAQGDSLQNREYCSKEGDFREHGEAPISNQRKGELEVERWENARASATSGEFDNIPADIFIRCYSSIRAIYRDYAVNPSDLPHCTGVWYYGPPGVGKSYTARLDFPGAYLKMANKWWDSYRNEKYVILDDFSLSHRGLGYHLKIWADRYAFAAEIKGSKINIRPEVFVVTSNYLPMHIFEDGAEAEAVARRFRIVFMPQPARVE